MDTIDDLNPPEIVAAVRKSQGRKAENKRNKFGAIPCKADGYSFDSKGERAYYFQLKMLAAGGIIENLEVHPKPRYVLQAAFTADNGEEIPAITHGPDFRWVDPATSNTVVADFKGRQLTAWKIRYRLFRKVYPHIPYVVATKKDLR